MNSLKVRLREAKSEDAWRYALTISKNGYILSSTFDSSKAQEFDESVVNSIHTRKTTTKLYEGTEIETF